MTLSPTQMQILTATAEVPDGMAIAPPGLPAAARNAVFRSMLKAGLLMGEGGAWDTMRITQAGRQAVASELQEPDEDLRTRDGVNGVDPRLIYGDDDPAPCPIPQAAGSIKGDPKGLRAAAEAVLAAWEGRTTLDEPMGRLRLLLTSKPARKARDPNQPRKPRQGTKQEAVLALLRRQEGATIAQVMEATSWAQHTVRGFFAGLKARHGIAVEVIERIRQVGPNKQGAKGSYSIYHVADAG